MLSMIVDGYKNGVGIDRLVKGVGDIADDLQRAGEVGLCYIDCNLLGDVVRIEEHVDSNLFTDGLIDDPAVVNDVQGDGSVGGWLELYWRG
jgi:hypothetical protein